MKSLQHVNPYASEDIGEFEGRQARAAFYDGCSTMQAGCPDNGSKVKAVALNTGSKTGASENKWIRFRFTGDPDTDTIVRFGGPGSLAGASPFHNLPPSAADSGATDQYGAGVRKTQGFSWKVNHQPVVVFKFQMFSDDALQINESPTYNCLWYDDTDSPNIVNVDHSFTRMDDNDRTFEIFGCWFLTALCWLEFNLLEAADASILLGLSGTSSVYPFREVGCGTESVLSPKGYSNGEYESDFPTPVSTGY